MKTIFALLLCLLISGNLMSQNKYTISGSVTDLESGEMIIGANIFVKALNAGTVSNNYGFFSLTLEASDSITLLITHVAYQPQVKIIELRNNIVLNTELQPGSISLDEVVVYSTPENENIQQVQMAVIDLPVKNLKEIPVILGETDILKVVQLLPGVQSGQEGTTGFHVRGGNADQNLVQLDEALVYNPNHLLGLFSTFNSNALNNATLIKGGFPAQYGGRLSSILDVSMKEGNNREYHVEGGLGFITTNLTVEGPIKKEKASFILSGRRTFIDLLINPFLASGNQSKYNFHDVNAKINWKVGKKDWLFLSFFTGNDDARLRSGQGINYALFFGNTTSTLRWNHIFSPKLFVNSSLIFNKYDQDVTAIQDNFFSQTLTGIEDVNGKVEFQYFPAPAHSIRFGFHYIDHKFISGGKSESQSSGSQNLNKSNITPLYSEEYAAYFNDEIKLSNRFSTSLGLRWSGYSAENRNYFNLEPRASIRMITSVSSSIKASYTEMNQYLHLIPSSTASIPTDIWIPSTGRTQPQKSKQIALGYFQNFKNNGIETSIEAYYKDMTNQVLFPEGNQLVENFDVDTSLVYGKGWSYGAEFYVKKKTGDFTGWVAYTLSWTWQQFDDLNFGEKFPFKYDRRHVVSVVGKYDINPKWTLSGVFVYNSGNPYTVPVGRFATVGGPTLFEGNYFVYEGRNNERMGDYHRLDISLIHHRERKRWGRILRSEWIFGVYNIYGRQNPYFIYFKVHPKTEQPQAVQVTLMPIIPSISYHFKF